jgi:uncharacterized protein YfaS (alpha-2-macroglobulin family)
MKTRQIFSMLLLILLMPLLLSAATQKPLHIKKVIQRSTQTSTSLCAEVDRYFSSTDGLAAKPYIKLSPPDYFGVTLSYDEICLTGLKPQTAYTFSIHQKIPLGKIGLDKSYQFTQKTTNYSPSLHFKDGGYILPAKGEISIPIESTNIDRFYVTLYRINRDNLIGQINRYGLFRTLSNYTLEQIKAEDGYLLWKKRLSLSTEKNHAKTTAIPVGKYLKERKPGVYILAATPIDKEGDEERYNVVTQWFMISDIGLFTLEGKQGLHVYSKHLSDAQKYTHVKLELVAKNNELLGSVMAKSGYALFPKSLLGGKQGLSPKAIYAYGETGDFTVLDLSRPAHTLSDRGVAGRKVPESYDAWLYSTRGIFRPGEQVPFHLLVRTPEGEAAKNLKLSAKLYDSRGVEITSRLLTTDATGHAQGVFDISASASTGKWKISLQAGEKQAIGRLSFLVEDFVPPKISLTLQQPPQILSPNTQAMLKGAVHYLTGEALPHAKIEVSTILHATAKPFKHYQPYHFGKAGEHFSNQSLGEKQFIGGAEGNLSIPFTLKQTTKSSLPIAAHITLSVSEPGGRPVQKTLDLFYADKPAYIGIKANFEHHAIDRDAKPVFDLVYLKDGKPATETLQYRIIAEEVYWNWRSGRDGDWEYYKTYSDAEEIRKGTIKTAAHPVSLTTERLEWGSYRIEVEADSGIISSYRFTSGYEESISRASPDRLPVAIDKQRYLPGEKIKVNITPKFSGPLMVSLANHRILETKELMATEGTPVTLTFETKASWGSSLYLLASAFRAQSKTLGATRAIGVAHIAIDDPQKVIQLTLDHPTRLTASDALTVEVTATNAAAKKTYLTLSAVDKGILQLTHYASPDPAVYFYGQKMLGIEIRDVYADLIKAIGAHAAFDVGAGDDDLAAALTDSVVSNKRKVVALLSDVIAFDKQGKATVTMDIPDDFQGTLVLTAVAWNADTVGSHTAEVLVKDPISTELYMPRFLTTGDQSSITLRSSFDASVTPGTYLLRLHTKGGVAISPQEIHYTVEGNRSHSLMHALDLNASGSKSGEITLEVLHDGKQVSERSWKIGIRDAYPSTYLRKLGRLNRSRTLEPNHISDPSQWQSVRRVRLTLSGTPLLPTDSLTQELIDYQGRCAEQTTSRAMPWLESEASDKKALLQGAIDRLTTMQRINGGFGLWSNSQIDPWITAYVLDLLTRAKAKGYSVPQKNINQGLAWLEQHLDRWSNSRAKQEADAYALYLLARNNHILLSEIHHHAANKQSLIRSAQAWGQLGAALSSLGETQQATVLFERAKQALGEGSYLNYGGALRNKAALVLLLKESGLAQDAQRLFADLALNLKKRKYLSTQEMSMLLRAQKALGIRKSKLSLSIDGTLYQKEEPFTTRADKLSTLPKIINQGDAALWYDLSFVATPDPTHYAPQENRGFSLEKQFYTLKGQPIDLSQVVRNSRIVVVLKGAIQERSIQHPLITDWLPAGFEIENPTLSGIDASDGLKWLGKKSATLHTEYRDDRFEAALRIDNNSSFTAAYVIRAVTLGSFTLPPAKIEDMYQPRYRAFSPFAKEKLSIKPPQEIQTKHSDPIEKAALTQQPKILDTDDYTRLYTHPVAALTRYNIVQLNYLRNGIFAQAGLDFEKSNPALHKRFSAFSWYKPTSSKSSTVYAKLTALQKKNIQALLAEEKRRCGGLVLADFYRVKIKQLDAQYLRRYSKRELRILRNSLIARYGLRFKEQELTRIYSEMPWYHPTEITASEIIDQKMSDLERANIQTILKVERQK